MEQVIINLALNARDAMDRGGNLTLTTRNATIDAEAARSHPDASPGQFVQFLVSDTGTGMSPEVRSHLFEPFFTTKPVGKGTGLGLATVYSIVHASGGFITVNSAQGSGTTFHGLAARRSRCRAGGARTREREHTRTRLGDRPGCRGRSRRAPGRSTRPRVRGLPSLDGAEWPRGAGNSGSTKPHVDLRLTDVVMPGMNGREVAARVRARLPDCRVLLMSGYFHDASMADEQGAGNHFALLQKPFAARGARQQGARSPHSTRLTQTRDLTSHDPRERYARPSRRINFA